MRKTFLLIIIILLCPFIGQANNKTIIAIQPLGKVSERVIKTVISGITNKFSIKLKGLGQEFRT